MRFQNFLKVKLTTYRFFLMNRRKNLLLLLCSQLFFLVCDCDYYISISTGFLLFSPLKSYLEHVFFVLLYLII